MAFIKRTKADVKSKIPFSRGGKTKKNKDVKSGVIVEFNDGDTAVLLTPAGRAQKFANELKDGVKTRNDGTIVMDEYGYPVDLISTQRAYRAGYLEARKDSAKAYKAKHGGGNK